MSELRQFLEQRARQAPDQPLLAALAQIAQSWREQAAQWRRVGDTTVSANFTRLATEVEEAIVHAAQLHPLPDDRLWTQEEAAQFLSVSPRYIRESTCPKVLLPGNGERGQSLVRYDPAEVRAWARNWHTEHARRRSA